MKFLFDILPLLVFFAAYKFYDIYAATAAAIIASVALTAIFWVRHRRLDTTLLVTLVAIVLLGGLTIVLRDDAFIKWKPTVVAWLFGAVIGAMMFTKKSALEYMLGKQLQLPPKVWRKVNLTWAGFFFATGALNIYIAFYYNAGADEAVRTQFWVNFKVFGLTALTFAFVLAQVFALARHFPADGGKS